MRVCATCAGLSRREIGSPIPVNLRLRYLRRGCSVIITRAARPLECGDGSAFFLARLILFLGGGGLAEVELESVEPGGFRIDALGLEFGRQAFVP